MGALQKLQNSIQTPQPNPYKLSILDDIWRAIIFPFSSLNTLILGKDSNLVDLSFEDLSF